MSSGTHEDVGKGLRPRELRLDRLLGRQLVGRNNRPVGRVEEFRAELRGGAWVITELVIGSAGIIERLGVGIKLLFGRTGGGHLARWDQVDMSDPEHPRLTCSLEELRKP
jgi:hypothetical protein